MCIAPDWCLESFPLQCISFLHPCNFYETFRSNNSWEKGKFYFHGVTMITQIWVKMVVNQTKSIWKRLFS